MGVIFTDRNGIQTHKLNIGTAQALMIPDERLSIIMDIITVWDSNDRPGGQLR